jgi:hypothetical protein
MAEDCGSRLLEGAALQGSTLFVQGSFDNWETLEEKSPPKSGVRKSRKRK